MIDQLRQTEEWLRENGIGQPETGIIMGTGLHALGDAITDAIEIPYEDIPHFPRATVEFHPGKLVYGNLNGRKVMAFKGRFHVYEGHDLSRVVWPVRIMKLMGAQDVLLSNAAGSVNPAFKKGSLMLLDDHINLQQGSPLAGPNIDELGPRFPDMSRPYSARLNAILRNIAAQSGITLHEGVYAAVVGPQLETRAEYRYLRIIGADAVGMSTVPEVIACNHMNLPCCCISVITDECDPDDLHPVDIQDIIDVANKAEKSLTQLFTELIGRL